MRDIVSVGGEDLGIFDTQVPRASNLLSIQLGSLEYAQTFGIDLAYFLSEEFRFQNKSFKAYLIQVLATNGINVATVMEEVENLYARFVVLLVPLEPNTSMIAR